jgi:hypothetical protein
MFISGEHFTSLKLEDEGECMQVYIKDIKAAMKMHSILYKKIVCRGQ